MRRAMTAACLALLLVGGLLPSATAGQGKRARQLAEVELEWVSDGLPDGFREMAFRGRLLVAALADTSSSDNTPTAPEGGIAVYRILDGAPYLRQLGALRCQTTGEITLVEDLVVVGVTYDRSRSEEGCNRNGLQLIDVSDPTHPRFSKFIPLGCGVAEHAIIESARRYYAVAPATCNELVDLNPQNTGIWREMAVVRIYPGRPGRSRVTSTPLNDTTGCVDVFVHAARKLMGCTFFGVFSLYDISDPSNPDPVPGASGAPFSFELSDSQFLRGAFTWDGQYLVLGVGPAGVDYRCPEGEQPSLYFFNIEDLSNPVLTGTWTIPRRAGMDCWSRGFNVLPTKNPNRYLLAGAFDANGISVVDFSDPTAAEEIAFYVPKFTPTDPSNASDPDPYLLTARLWAAYWYNGRVYATAQAEDVPRLRVFDVEGLDRSSVLYFSGTYNPQTQIARFR